MDKLVDIFLGKESIDHYRILRALKVLFNIVIATWLYKAISGNLEIIDYDSSSSIADLVLNGPLIIAITCYFIVWLGFGVIYTLLFIYYSQWKYPRAEALIQRTEDLSDPSAITIDKILLGPLKTLKNFMVRLKLASVENDRIVLDRELELKTKEFLQDPRKASYNLYSILIMFIQFTISFIIAASAMHLSPAFITTILIIDCLLILFLFRVVNVIAHIEVLAPFITFSKHPPQVESSVVETEH